MKQNNDIAVGCIGAVFLLLVGSLMGGWALSVLWGWFLVPLGAPAVTIPQAIGLRLIVGLVTLHVATEKRTGDDMLALIAGVLFEVVGTCILYLILGWITVQFM